MLRTLKSNYLWVSEEHYSDLGHFTVVSCNECYMDIDEEYRPLSECCKSPCTGAHTNNKTDYLSNNVHHIELVCEVCGEFEDTVCDDSSNCNVCWCVHAFTTEVNISYTHTQSGHLCDVCCDSCKATVWRDYYTVLSSCCIGLCPAAHIKTEVDYHLDNAHYVVCVCLIEDCDYAEESVLYTDNSGVYPGCFACSPCANGHNMSLKNYHFGDAHYTENQCTTTNCNYIETEVVYDGEYPDCFSCNASDGKECPENFGYNSEGVWANLQHLYDIVDNFHEDGNHFVTYECSKCLEQYNVKLELKFAGCAECACTHSSNTEGPCYVCEFFNESNPENSKILYPFAQVLCDSQCATTCKYYNKLHCVPKTVSTGYEERDGSFHYALDIFKRSSSGVNITNQYDLIAPFNGTVIYRDKSDSRGNYIVIEYAPEKDENGVIINDEKIIDPLSRQRIVVMYLHMDTLPSIAIGSTIEKGTVIAKAGASGKCYSAIDPPEKAYHLDLTVITNNQSYAYLRGSYLTDLNTVDPCLIYESVFGN